MEELLLPFKPTSPTPKVPYVCQERYDGLPFLTYSQRKGHLYILPPSRDLSAIAIQGPTPSTISVREQECFFQTWLFFGLLCEFFHGNVADESQAPAQENINAVYENFVQVEHGKQFVTMAKFLPIVQGLVAKPDEEVKDLEPSKARLSYLSICIRHTSSVLQRCADGFDLNIRLSIAALGEALMHIVAVSQQEVGMKLDVFCLWTRGSFTAQMREEMLQHGWCPSDITKCSIAFHDSAKSSQIDLSKYHVGHINDTCNCTALTIDNTPVIEILCKDDLVPVLKIYGGEEDINDLSIDVIESSPDLEYVALSHVWADGLGNPFANSLYRCQIGHIRDLIKEIRAFQPQNVDGKPETKNFPVLLWLDTLCCPVRPPNAKRMAIEKIRNVYQEAACVLVLDASLRAYEAGPMTPFEVLARISTSGWMKRLWTLQEGALAKALLFQFADQAFALNFVMSEVQKKWDALVCHHGLALDVQQEVKNIKSFFAWEQYGQPPANLAVLDACLNYRSVTVATDEPLCIGTLMGLDLPTILSAPEIQRMCLVWELLSKSKQGIPSSIIFFTEPRIARSGFRWAPVTLLGFGLEGSSPEFGRFGNWNAARSEGLTLRGLKVQFPGFRLSSKSYHDGLPRNPWWGSLRSKDGQPQRLIEAFIHIRTAENEWFRFCKQDIRFEGRLATHEDDREWKRDMEYPLFDMASTSRCLLLMRQIPETRDDLYKPFSVGLIVFPQTKADESENVDTEPQTPHPLCVRTEGFIQISKCKPSEILVLETCERIATHIRATALTRKLCEIGDHESEKYKCVMGELKSQMKTLMKKALEDDPELVNAVHANWKDFLDDVWKYVANWYCQDVFVAEKLVGETVWVVD